MTWNYRIFKHTHADEVGYGLHEAYYDKSGKMDGYTETSFAYGDTVDELIEVLTMMLNDAKKSKADIFDFKSQADEPSANYNLQPKLDFAESQARKWKKECQNLMEERRQLLEEKEELLARSLKKP